MRLVDVSSLLFITFYQPLFCHNLQEFEDGCVARRPLFVEGFLDLADGAGTALPEHSQYCEFSVGWPWRTALCHWFHSSVAASYYEGLRSVNEILRRELTGVSGRSS